MVIDLASEQTFPVGELVGVAIAIILLTLLFRSGAAMAATLIGALIGVMVGQILLTALAKPLGLPDVRDVIAMMLGLGAGIDYSLLIIGRYREQAAAGDCTRDASAKAAATSGASVVAAGLIVMVAIAGLLVIGIPFIGKLGIASAIGVGAVVVSALTILPIMIGALARWLKPKKPEHVLPSRAFERWGERVTARPWLSIAAGVLAAADLRLPGHAAAPRPARRRQPAESRTQRVAYDQLSEAFGPGSNGPFLLAVDMPKGARRERAQLQTAAAGGGATRPASPPSRRRQPSEDGEMATIFAIPTTAPQDAKTSDLLERLRDDVIPGATEGTPLKVYVGGNTAGFEDFSDKVSSRLPLFIAVVIGLSVLLLIAAFRSLWIPLVSAVFNLLSIGAAYGVVTAVFQEGIGASLIGADSGVPIVSFIPVMMFAILFGLSMDYNVFLLSRIHEAYNEGDRPRESVIHGMSRIGKVILFAGLIMAVGLPRLRHAARHHREDVRRRPRPRDPDRRADRPARDRARRRHAARRPRLVAAGLAGPAPPERLARGPPRRLGRRQGARDRRAGAGHRLASAAASSRWSRRTSASSWFRATVRLVVQSGARRASCPQRSRPRRTRRSVPW